MFGNKINIEANTTSIMGILMFEHCLAWQKAQDLAIDIYTATKSIDDVSFRNQIRRAATSVSNNIAEGFSRSSSKDFGRFLGIALGSCNEVKSMLYLSTRIGLIHEEVTLKLIEKCNETAKLTRGLLKSLNRNLV